METINLNEDQAKAKAAIEAWLESDEPWMSLSGPAGTGKTTLLRHLRLGDVQWTAMTGKAALRIQEASEMPAVTLHKALYLPPNDEDQDIRFDHVNAPQASVLVVDEASMITPDILDDLKTWADQGVKILFVGDGFQLPPVLSKKEEQEYGGDFTVFERVKGPSLEKVMRNGDAILDAATHLRRNFEIPRASKGSYRFEMAPFGAALLEYLTNPEDHALITWRNEIRMEAAKRIRAELGRTSPVPQPGEPVLFCRNGWGVLNGEIGTVEDLQPGPEFGPVKTGWLKVAGKPKRVLVTLQGKTQLLDGTMPFLPKPDWDAYRAGKKEHRVRWDPIPITWGYVLTAHKAQGSEFKRVTVYLDHGSCNAKAFAKPSRLPDGRFVPFFARWIYTAITRAKEYVTLVVG